MARKIKSDVVTEGDHKQIQAQKCADKLDPAKRDVAREAYFTRRLNRDVEFTVYAKNGDQTANRETLERMKKAGKVRFVIQPDGGITVTKKSKATKK